LIELKMINKKLLIITLIIILSSLNLSCETSSLADITNTVDEPFDIIQEEYAVFKTLLREESKNYVVLNEPPDEAFGITTEFFKDLFEEIQTDTLSSYAERNRMPLMINKPPFDFDFPVVNGKQFKNKLEVVSRYYEFSRVGFSKDGKQALVYFANNCQPLCGKGAYYFLKKERNIWKAKESESWVS
jgi:hypothetical protein